jgi:hypothetical protein
LSSTTVLIADLPPMLEDMVSSLLRKRSDLRVVRAPKGASSLVDAAVSAGARLVVTACRDPLDLRAVDSSLADAASLSILALSRDGGSAGVHELRPILRRLDDVSADQILAILASPAGRA